MKIISWNCCGKFRSKFMKIAEYDADIYIIQECENPQVCNDIGYKLFSSNSAWIGHNPNKGLGVFCKDTIRIRNNHWETYCLRHFLSLSVNDEFNLLAVWACKPYIEEYYIYQCINREKYSERDILIFGDFNSNKIWDKDHADRSHSVVLTELNQLDIYSVYHRIYHEIQGEESRSTFYLHRRPEHGFHIDHCFTNLPNIKSYEILPATGWLDSSDHVPIILET